MLTFQASIYISSHEYRKKVSMCICPRSVAYYSLYCFHIVGTTKAPQTADKYHRTMSISDVHLYGSDNTIYQYSQYQIKKPNNIKIQQDKWQAIKQYPPETYSIILHYLNYTIPTLLRETPTKYWHYPTLQPIPIPITLYPNL